MNLQNILLKGKLLNDTLQITVVGHFQGEVIMP